MSKICESNKGSRSSKSKSVGRKVGEKVTKFDEWEQEVPSIDQPATPTLFQLLLDKCDNSKNIAALWLRRYRADNNAGMLELMQLVLEASGCQYQLPPTLHPPYDFSEILITATVNFGNKSQVYPLIASNRNILTEALIKFVHQLFLQLERTLNHEKFFLETICNFLSNWTHSKVRPFRHTSMFICLKLMTVWTLIADPDDECLKQFWMDMFNKLYVPRLMDVVEDVRKMCIFELRLWLKQYPSSYVGEQHVCLLYESLKDCCPSVCEEGIDSLIFIFKNPTLRSIMIKETSLFRMNLAGLALGDESELCEKAVQLLVMCYRESPSILTENLLEIMEQLVFAHHRGLAQAAALIIPVQQHDSDRENLRTLVQFFIKMREHEHAAYLVDSFYDRNVIIQEWEAMLDILIEPRTFTAREISALIEILKCAVRQSVTGEVPPGRSTDGTTCEPMTNARKRATNILLPKLPVLLRRYGNDVEDLCNLLELPKYMRSSKENYTKLLDQIESIISSHENERVMTACATTLEYLYQQNTDGYPRRNALLCTAISHFRTAVAAWDRIAPLRNPIDDVSAQMQMRLKLLFVLYSHFDMNSWKIISLASIVLRDVIEKLESSQVQPPEQNLKYYLGLIFLAVSWELNHIAPHRDEAELVKKCESLQTLVLEFTDWNFKLMQLSTSRRIACDAFEYNADLFIVFSDKLFNSSSAAIKSLQIHSNQSHHNAFEKYMLSFVFDNANLETVSADEMKSKRRVLTSYLKMIFNNVIPMMRSCVVLRHYEQYYTVYGDVMRASMERCVTHNSINFGMTLLHTTLLVYKEIRVTYPDSKDAVQSPQFDKLLRLATMLSEMLYIKQLKSRPGCVLLHRAGIRYAAESTSFDGYTITQNLLFLKVLQQFVPQLLAQDMLGILDSLKYIEQPDLTSQVEELNALHSYRSALEAAIRKSCRRNELSTVLNDEDSN